MGFKNFINRLFSSKTKKVKTSSRETNLSWQQMLLVLGAAYEKKKHEFGLEVIWRLEPVLERAKDVSPQDWSSFYSLSILHLIALDKLVDIPGLIQEAELLQIDDINALEFFFAKGDFYKKIKNSDNAIEAYQKCKEIIEERRS